MSPMTSTSSGSGFETAFTVTAVERAREARSGRQIAHEFYERVVQRTVPAMLYGSEFPVATAEVSQPPRASRHWTRRLACPPAQCTSCTRNSRVSWAYSARLRGMRRSVNGSDDPEVLIRSRTSASVLSSPSTSASTTAFQTRESRCTALSKSGGGSSSSFRASPKANRTVLAGGQLSGGPL